MMNWLSKAVWLVLVTVLAVAGCEQERKQEQKVDLSASRPPYITQAIEATGGLEAWIGAKQLNFDCVVAFYRQDGSFYLTEQSHEIVPWSNSIRISAQEPQGKFIWEFSLEGMRVIEGTKKADFLPIGLGAEDFAQAILDTTTTPVRLLGGQADFIKGTSPVKVEGRWYYPIQRVELDKPASAPIRPKLVFYQNRESSFVDLLWFESIDKGTYFTVRGYNYHEVKKGGVVVPAKIEIFMTDIRGAIQHRLVKIDYHQLKATQ